MSPMYAMVHADSEQNVATTLVTSPQTVMIVIMYENPVFGAKYPIRTSRCYESCSMSAVRQQTQLKCSSDGPTFAHSQPARSVVTLRISSNAPSRLSTSGPAKDGTCSSADAQQWCTPQLRRTIARWRDRNRQTWIRARAATL